MNVYVVRHGETIINVKREMNGHNEIDLNEAGIRQAEDAAEKLKNIKLDVIYSSPLRRARHTAQIINKNNIDIKYDDKLMERNYNSLQFLPVSMIDRKMLYDLDKDATYSDSENFKSVLDRVTIFLNEIKDKYHYQNILLVTHGDVCKAIKLYFDGADITDISKFDQKNCEIVKYVL